MPKPEDEPDSTIKRQRGNILFLILLAVVLFAALSYAVTQSTRGSGNDASNEKVQAQAAELMNYFASIDLGVQRMLTTGGIKDYELNFFYQTAGNYVFGSLDNTNCTESRCRVFDPAGGGVIGRKTAAFARDPANAVTNTLDSARLVYASIPGAGTSKTDIVFWVGGVSMPLCREINKRFSVNGGEVIYGNVDAAQGSTIMHQYAVPVGPIPDNIYTALYPSEAGVAGTFCTCPYASPALCETTSVFRPSIAHVIVAR